VAGSGGGLVSLFLRVDVVGEATRDAPGSDGASPYPRTFCPMRATNINLSVNVSGRESRHLEWRLGDPYEYQQVVEL
jgi:hypothetical protein